MYPCMFQSFQLMHHSGITFRSVQDEDEDEDGDLIYRGDLMYSVGSENWKNGLQAVSGKNVLTLKRFKSPYS